MDTNHLDKQNFFDLGNLNTLRQDALKSDASPEASKEALKKQQRHNLNLFLRKCY
ncbi:hypothetical protein KAN5_18710 [Pseudoalteromonas sp. KAN5]|nr:hypothetical protein KAN5_18710 [Pseudoalteromonas sp. KAN5]